VIQKQLITGDNFVLKKLKIIIKILFIYPIIIVSANNSMAAESLDLLKNKWSFEGFFGTFDRASLRRGYQVYNEVCSGCHSMKLLSYRNLSEKGGPEFSREDSKNIAASFEVVDGPNSEGEMFTRSGRLSDKFVKPYLNVQAAETANGGAYPPDMSVLAKARKDGANYIYSILLGYEDPPEGFELDEGVYYNKYMPGHSIKMPNVLFDGLLDYADGTEATTKQMAKDIVTFLAWASEPSLEARHKIGFKVILYLIILAFVVHLSLKKLWSRVESK
jgi:ubiquinol-cytochrome c reductase cytochrome c1 subunit